ncbi:hypothetical protein C0J52_02200 [Blattella germanica]|nr:hypothetical protein C0J52_02200 [Blattella germanica]
MENGVSPVSCPVCTLYLREGVTLQSHLNTHPKDQVIAALVRISGGKVGTTDIEAANTSQQQEEFTPSGSSHFTTAITYQQYLSSNGSAPQYISMPTILSAPSTATHSTTNQAAFMQMLYNPYVIQQQQQQFQLLSSVTSPTHPQSYVRHVVPPYPSQSVSIPFQPNSAFPTDLPPQGFQNTNGVLSSSAPLPTSNSSSSLPCPVSSESTVHITQGEPDVANGINVPEMSEQSKDAAIPQDLEGHNPESEKDTCSTGVATQTILCDEEDQKSPKDEQSFIENEKVEEVESGPIESPRNDAVRVRTDLNDVAVSPMDNPDSLDRESEDQYANGDVSQISGIIRNALRIQTPPLPPMTPADNEYITYDQPENTDCMPSKDDTVKEKENVEETTNRFLDLDSSETVNIIEIDGIHILVPSEFLEKSAAILENTEEAPRETDVDASSVNIQTDETMPPRGELSEQESVGGNDSSMWVQAFHEKEVSTSYDLLARESWEASDGSDVDSSIQTNTPKFKKTRQSRVYKCSTCGEQFNCPKERRVHHSTFHSVKSTNREAETSSSRKSGSVYKQNTQARKTVEVEADRSEQNQFLKVFLTESQIEPEEKEPLKSEEKPAENNIQTEVKLEPSAIVPKEEDVKTEFPCTICDEVFTTSKQRNSHERKSHKKSKEKKNICGTCKEEFPNDAEYHVHLQTHPLECSQCGKFFYRRQNLELHVKRHLGIRPHKCTICDKAFVTKQKLAEHTNSHTGNAPIKCPLCDETFRRYSNLIQHKQRHHLNIKKKVKDFICHCGEVFHSKKKLEWHKEIHEEKPKCCTYCSERFVHSASLTRHIRKAHDCRYVPKCGREVENIECNICGYIFLKSSMAVHMRMHSGERPYPCHVCGKEFTTKWNLQLHRWTHAARSTKPFKCSLCKSAFFRRSDYTAHMHSHRNVRPYTCNHCGCQFIRKYNCLRHVREHEVNKSFNCNVCGKSFHRSYYLKEHLRVHSGARPFACHICGKASSTKSNHNKHVKIHHAREPVNTEG